MACRCPMQVGILSKFSVYPVFQPETVCVPRRFVRTAPRKIGLHRRLEVNATKGDEFRPERQPTLRDLLTLPVGPGIIAETRKSEARKSFAKTFRRHEITTFLKSPVSRGNRMPTDGDWTKMWPTAETFNWAKFPVDITQGNRKSKQDNPRMFQKDVNLELIKIPNFLHLTNAHIAKHCKALKPFLTKWPSELSTDLSTAQHFPVEIVTEDYVRSSPSIREPKSRIVTLKVRLGSLQLDEQARNKLIRLVNERYDAETDILTIVGDRCPRRKQNEDYVKYLLTVLYMESKKVQPWESDVTEEDLLKFNWDLSSSRQRLKELKPELEDSSEEVEQYKEALAGLHENESEEVYDKYRESVIKLLGVKASSSGS